MRLGNVIIAACALLVIIPGLALADLDDYTVHASYISLVEPDATCEGWIAEVVVRFRWEVEVIDATFELVLTDDDGIVLETFSWDEQLTRSADEYAAKAFHFAGGWSVFAPTGDYNVDLTMSIEAPYTDGIDIGEMSGEKFFHCEAVGTEAASLTDIRALYN